MKKHLITLSKFMLMFAMMCLPLVSCGGDDDEPSSDSGSGSDTEKPGDWGDDSDITNDKLYLEQTANEFLNRFRASDQAAVITMANEFVNDYGDLDFPEKFTDLAPANPALAMMKNIAISLSSKTLGISRAYDNYFYAFSDFTGVYEPGRYMWNRVADSDAIIFRYTNRSGEPCTIQAVASGGTWDGSIKIDGDTYKATVPKVIDITVTKGSAVMLSAQINLNYSKNSHLTVDVVTKAANLEVKETVNANNSIVTSNTQLIVSGSCILTANANVTGSRLCDQDYIQTLIEQEDGETLCKMFTQGTATSDVLGRVQVKGSISNLFDIIEACDFDGYDYFNSNAENDAKNAARVLNNNLKSSFYYNGTSNVRGSLSFQAYISYISSWSGSKEWGIEPLLVFKDGTKYSFEDYFGEGRFGNVESSFENIIDTYKALWK